jgi:hypothetical protein
MITRRNLIEMKQIGVRLDEELVKKAKQFALDNKLTMQTIISEALTSYLDNKLTTTESNDNKLTSEHDNMVTKKSPFIIDTRDHPEGTHIFITEDHAYDLYRDESPELPPVKTSDFYLPIEERENPPLDPNDPIQKMLIDAGMY